MKGGRIRVEFFYGIVRFRIYRYIKNLTRHKSSNSTYKTGIVNIFTIPVFMRKLIVERRKI